MFTFITWTIIIPKKSGFTTLIKFLSGEPNLTWPQIFYATFDVKSSGVTFLSSL